MVSFEEINEDLVKEGVLEFLGNEKNIKEQFLFDTMKPRPLAMAWPQPILNQILDVLRENSQMFYGIFATIIVSLGIYFISRQAAKRDKEEILFKIREILNEKRGQIQNQIKVNLKTQSKLKWNVGWKIQCFFDRKSKEKWEIKLRIYTEKASRLLNVKESAEIISDIINRKQSK